MVDLKRKRSSLPPPHLLGTLTPHSAPPLPVNGSFVMLAVGPLAYRTFSCLP